MTYTDWVEKVVHDGDKVCLVTNEHCVCLWEEMTNKLKPVWEHVIKPRIGKTMSKKLWSPGVSTVRLKAQALKGE